MPLISRLVRKGGPLGLYALARYLCRNHPRILMYHRFSDKPSPGCTSEDQFREQVAYIQRHFYPLTLGDLARRVFEQRQIPKHAVVITVDDGYRDFYDIAWPILREYKVPATLFATTGFINGDLWLWPDQVSWLLQQTQEVPTDTHCGPITLEAGVLRWEQRNRYWHALIDFLLSVSDEKKYCHIKELEHGLGQRLPVAAPTQYGAMTWQQLKAVHDAGIEVGGHTVSHPSLGQVGDEQAQREIEGCRDTLRENLGHYPYSFCYPNGKRSDFSETVAEIVKNAGFGNAVVAFHDAQGFDQRYAIRRYSAGNNRFQFMKAVNGVELLGNKLGRLR